MSGKRSLMGMTLLVFGLSWLYPLWPREQALHSSLTVVGLVLLFWHDRRVAMTLRAYALVCLFIAAHCLAARWLYSNVPYDRWMDAMFGWSPGQAWGVTRNHTDRVIHLLYGVCLTPALVEWSGWPGAMPSPGGRPRNWRCCWWWSAVWPMNGLNG